MRYYILIAVLVLIAILIWGLVALKQRENQEALQVRLSVQLMCDVLPSVRGKACNAQYIIDNHWYDAWFCHYAVSPNYTELAYDDCLTRRNIPYTN